MADHITVKDLRELLAHLDGDVPVTLDRRPDTRLPCVLWVYTPSVRIYPYPDPYAEHPAG